MGGARTRQKLVGRQEVLATVNGQRLLLDQRCAHGVGALFFFRPIGTGYQCHTGRFFDEVGIAQRMQDHAARRCQRHHAVGVHDLVVQGFHHRLGVLEQEPAFFQCAAQFAPRNGAEVGVHVAFEPMGHRTVMRCLELPVSSGQLVAWRVCRVCVPIGTLPCCQVHFVSRVWECLLPSCCVPWQTGVGHGSLFRGKVVFRIHAILVLCVP